ncbi:50S ribosomal protein L6 [Candidatus Woesearchaeota archaeon]|nr:50S ribosomal protein L6 [Candidatus Woesearchaeota archaeon]
MKKVVTRKSQVKIPSGVEVSLDHLILKVKGTNGTVERDFSNPRIRIERDNDMIKVLPSNKKLTKKDKMYINTTLSHIENIISGVSRGYEAKLKICSGHFPMSVTLEGKNIIVKNFLGEKIPRKTQITEGVSVKIEGDIIKVTGCDKEKVGQTAATIESSCRIKNRDLRLFQDGIWLLDKVKEKND